MNIWVIGRSFPTKQNKMRGSFELEQAQLLATHGHHVTYLAAILHPINKVKNWGFCHFMNNEVSVYTVSVFFAPERMHLHPKKFLIMLWKKLLSVAESEQGIPDIIHIHYPGMNSVPEAVLPYQKKGTKIVITDHWSKTLTDSMDSFQRQQLIEYVNVADAVLCVGQPLKEALLRITKTVREVLVIPNVVSNIFSLMPPQKDKTVYDFITVGRLEAGKQVDRIVLAFAKEFAGNMDVRLTIVGCGKEKGKIEKMIKEYGIRDQVLMTGTLPREETAKRMMGADSLICYSQMETFGVPVIEAWACGKPVIASDALGFLEYWDDGLGFVVSKKSIDELRSAMRQIIDKKNVYDAEKIALFAVEHFGEEAIYRKLIDVYTTR